MPKSVVICEKASQAKDLKTALGSKYGVILPARGHILTLKEPDEVREDWKTWSSDLLWNDEFYPKKPVKDAQALLSAIRNAITDADQVIIATDCDREGQLIGDEILEFLRFNGTVKRAMFTAQDPISLRKAFDNLEDNSLYHGRYMAGQAREQADQATNLSLTRTATTVLKAPGGKGAIGIGRVKTPVLGIVCKRELEIMNFKPQDMFEIDAETEIANGKLKLSCVKLPASLVKQEEEAEDLEEDELAEGEEALAAANPIHGKIMKKEIAAGLADAVKGHEGPLNAKFEKKRQSPPKLFDLTALTSACSSKFGWGGEKTLEIAQSLYASPHHILTYPRGEAQYLPENEIPNVPQMVRNLLDVPAYSKHDDLLSSPQVRKGKSGHFSDAALEGFSHYAIIPNINAPNPFREVYPKLTDDQRKLFDLVSKQYMAAMAPDFEYRQTSIDMKVPWKGHNWDFKNSGRVPLVQGWKEILTAAPAKAGQENDFPKMENGEPAKIVDAKVRSVTTRPPARYSEGSLQQVMKDAWRLVDDPKQKARLKLAEGIGRPATRAIVIGGLIKQGQIMNAAKSVKPTPGGLKLYETLMKVCPNVVDPGRTAIWETIFDMVESGKMTAADAIDKINGMTRKEIANIKAATVKIEIGGTSKPTAKMAKFAKQIAERKDIKMPAGTLTNSAKCSAFIDQHTEPRAKNADGSNAPFAPSAKQLEFAQKLADQTGKEIPENAMTNGKELSTWIDKAKKAAPPRPPSEKQISFAEKLADQNGKELTDAIRNDMAKCSKFIDDHMGKAKKSESAGPGM